MNPTFKKYKSETLKPVAALRQEIIGVDHEAPLLDGRRVSYVNLDNAASTPPLRRVKEKVDEIMDVYSSVHRGSGFKSLLSTYIYDTTRQVVADFVGANPQSECVIFVKNTTEAINKLANRFPFQPGDIVLTTVMEHHSNDLPWRARAKVLHAEIQADGSLDLNDLEDKLKQNLGKVKLVSVTGASNVSGFLPPIYEIAEIAHQYGIPIFVDCAQLLPHRQVIMGEQGTPRHLDFIAFSGHKVYAPFGGSALIGPREFFNRGDPDARGGGTVEIVTLDEVEWTTAPERDEAGSPNVIGSVALAAALQELSEVGMEALAQHEKDLTRYTLERLGHVQGVRIFGSSDPNRLEDRIGVIPFEITGLSHAKLAAILGFEEGIGLRNGCFCAHPYVLRLLHIGRQEFLSHRNRIMDHDRSELPGFVRASFGCYNNFEDIDRLVDAVKRIAAGDYHGDYQSHRQSGSCYPRGFEIEQMDQYFKL